MDILTRESSELQGDTLTITVGDAYSKRRRLDIQPIRQDLALMLRPWFAGKPPGRPVFPIDSHHTADLIRTDLKAPGLP